MTTGLHVVIFVCLWLRLQALRISSSNISTPSFYMMDHPSFELYGQHWRELYPSGFQHHPARVNSSDDADFVVTCCFQLDSLQKFVDLPRRSRTKPYLVMAHGLNMDVCYQPEQFDNCALAKKLKDEREDFTFVKFDLRGHLLTKNHAKPLPGVTMPPPKWYTGPPLSPLQETRYYMTFRGGLNDGFMNSSHVRSRIQKSFEGFQSNGIVVEVLSHQGLTYTDSEKIRYNTLLNTSYALVPHGDLRWSFRFSEVIGACAIPVVISDGLTLPFEELVDWRAAAVILEEETFLLHGTESLLQQLPTNPDEIREKRQRVCEINDKYFASEEKRVTALLKAAAIRAHR